ncbi:MAG: DUF1501 domain-containing protein [Gemmataceae bacterium]
MRPTDCEGFYRRDFLKIGSTGLLGLSLPQMLRIEARAEGKAESAAKKAKSVIMVWLAGGPATIDMWDIKPDAPEGIRSEFKSIPTKVAGIEISEHMPKMAQVMNRVTLVRSIAHTIPSHEFATNFMTTGNKPTAALQFPSMGSVAAKLLPVERGVPPYVSFGDLRGGKAGGPGYLGTGYNPFFVEGAGGNAKGAAAMNLRVRGIQLPQSFTLDDLSKRDDLLKSFDTGLKALDNSGDVTDGLDGFHKQALEILRSNKTKRAFNLGEEPQALREKYGTTGFGTGAIAARRLVEAGVRFVTVSLGGWDTHDSTFTKHKTSLQPSVDQTVSTLIADLDDRGLLDSTIVYVAGEFGRTPKINPRAGRDHWARSMAVLLAGGGLKRGYLHGATDSQGAVPATDPVSPDDVAATIFHCLGINPHTELQTPTGRPVQLFREGKVVEKMLA